nr:hypothetical protein KPHV_08180 [Kitasatospora purpeofusca]
MLTALGGSGASPFYGLLPLPSCRLFTRDPQGVPGRPRERRRLPGPNASSATDFLAWYARWLDHLLDGRDNRALNLTSLALRAPADRILRQHRDHEDLSLPQDFVTFCTSSNLRGSLDSVSVTGCWISLSAPLPSPVETGAFLVRFFRDQQDCVFWYLYLRPSGEVFVVNSSLDYEFEYEARDSDDYQPESDLDDPVAQEAEILWCAPSFEHFAYRFWLENRLWRAVNGRSDEPLDAELKEYLDHYRAVQRQV